MMKILIAEDDLDLRSILHDLLEASGYKTFRAADGREALVLVNEEKPDLLVLDMAMPELDGWHVAETLRKSPATLNLPIIALTAHAMAGDREKALKAGCDGYLTKPFLPSDLLNEIHHLLEQPHARRF